MIKIIKQTLTTEFVDTESGEIFKETREFKDDSVKTPRTSKKSSTKSKIDDSDPEPKLILESNKYLLNASAIETLGIEVGDTVDIKNQKIGNKRVKVIGPSSVFNTKSGNKLTKSGSVSYRGKANDELAELGNIFVLTPHPNADGLFILNGDNNIEAPSEPEPEIEDIQIDEDIDLDDDTIEISDNDFDFNF